MTQDRVTSPLTEIHNPHRPLTGAFGGSETSFSLNLAVLLVSVMLTAVCYVGGVTDYLSLFFVLILSVLILTVVLEWIFFRVHRRCVRCAVVGD